MKLKSFNESINESVWTVIICYSDGDIDSVKTFRREIDAADYFIKSVNDKYHTNFELMKENDVRLFKNPKENPDYLSALNIATEKNDNRGHNDGFIYIYNTDII